MRRATAPLRRRPLPLLTASALYSDQGWLERCYQQWDDFMRTIVRDKPRSKVLYVEPCRDEVASATFRLIGSRRGGASAKRGGRPSRLKGTAASLRK